MKLSNRTRSILKMVAFTTLISCCYLGVYHSHRYFEFDMILMITMLGLLSIIGLDFLYFNMNSKWAKFRTFVISILIGGPIAVIVIILHERYVDKQLKNYGTSSYGIVTRLYSEKKKRSTSHYAEFEYIINGKRWIQKIRNDDRTLNYGDTLNLRCSAQDPEVFQIEK